MFSVVTFVPWVAHVGGMAPSLIIIVVGVLVYLIVLLFPRSDKLEKVARACVFTLLGVLGGLVSTYAMQGTKAMMQVAVAAHSTQNPAPLLNPAAAIIGFSWPLQVFTTLMIVAAIYLLAKRNPRGWWLALIAGSTAIVANFPTQIVRMITPDFLYAGILAVLLVISLLIPAFKKRLIGEER